ncbi:MAG: ABC transporter ATP-binding protein [Desulfobacterales bacterium]|nr:ABC transporter ATP-binding protein [Desulfobacterales bacterium]
MLKVNNLETYYGELKILKNVSFSIDEGQLVLLLGPNGHGKSTFLKTICGLVKPRKGSVFFDDLDITKKSVLKIVEMGLTYIPEDRHLFTEMSVRKNMLLGAYSKKARKREKENLEYVFELFPRLKERENQFASTLSGGEARMLAIARGLMSDAKFLAIDEPTLGLSPSLRMSVYDIIRKVSKLGKTVLLVDQSIPDLADMADKIYFMEEGHVTHVGKKEDALKDDKLREIFLGM